MQSISVAGIPFMFSVDANGFYVTAFTQYVQIDGSPLVVRFNPPVDGIDNVPVAAILLALLAALANGAVIVGLA